MPYQNYESERFSDLKQMLRTMVRRRSDRPILFDCQEDGQRAVSFGRFADDTESLACELVSAGLGNAHIAILGESGYAWTQAFFGVVCGAGVAVPIDKDLSSCTVAELIALTDVRAVIFSEEYASALSEVDASVVRISFSEMREWIDRGSRRLYYSGDHRLWNTQPDEAEICVLMPTMGDTGARAAVQLSHANLCTAVYEIAQMISIGEEDLFFSVLPACRIYGLVYGLLLPISRGVPSVFSTRTDRMIEDMRTVHPTVLIGSAVVYERIYRKIWENVRQKGIEAEIRVAIRTTDAMMGEKAKMSSKRQVLSQIHKIFGGNLRLMLSLGERPQAEIASGLRALGFAFLNGVGAPECSGLMAVNRDGHYRDGSLGLVTPGSLVDICNAQSDGIGEIRVRGAQVTAGYYNADQITSRRISDKWFYTGLLGSVDADGFLYAVGHKKNAIAVAGGYLVSPEMIETRLLAFAAVRDAAVTGYAMEDGKAVPVALICPADGVREIDLRAAVAELNATLPEYQRIAAFVTVNVPFGRTASGRLRRVGLSETFAAIYRK